MSRKNRAPKREVLADPLYNSKIVTRLINRVMLDGKRGTAATIVYDAFEQIKEATGNDALEVFETAMENIMPVLEVRQTTKSQLKFVQNVVQLLVFVGWLTHHVRVVNTL